MDWLVASGSATVWLHAMVQTYFQFMKQNSQYKDDFLACNFLTAFFPEALLLFTMWSYSPLSIAFHWRTLYVNLTSIQCQRGVWEIFQAPIYVFCLASTKCGLLICLTDWTVSYQNLYTEVLNSSNLECDCIVNVYYNEE